jgi:hypothetical protein
MSPERMEGVDLMQAHDEKFPQSASGSLYPTHYVVGVIDDVREAERAEQAFRNAGYDSSTLRLFGGREAVEKAQELEAQKNWVQHLLSGFQNAPEATSYQQEAQRGHNILNVRANSHQEVEHIRDLLVQFHAHMITFFGPWSVEDLSSRDTRQQ